MITKHDQMWIFQIQWRRSSTIWIRMGVEGVTRVIFTLPVEAARAKAREVITLAPQGGQLTIVEQWRQLPDGQIQLTLRQLRAGD
jgi:hypothetical protein